MLKRGFVLLAFVGLLAVPAPSWADTDPAKDAPTLMVRIRSIDGLMEDAKYLAALAGRPHQGGLNGPLELYPDTDPLLAKEEQRLAHDLPRLDLASVDSALTQAPADVPVVGAQAVVVGIAEGVAHAGVGMQHAEPRVVQAHGPAGDR